jgi:hypothetical protein
VGFTAAPITPETENFCSGPDSQSLGGLVSKIFHCPTRDQLALIFLTGLVIYLPTVRR